MLRIPLALATAFLWVSSAAATAAPGKSAPFHGQVKTLLNMSPPGMHRFRLEVPTGAPYSAEVVEAFIEEKAPDIGTALSRPGERRISAAVSPVFMESVKARFPGIRVEHQGEEGPYRVGHLSTSAKNAHLTVGDTTGGLVIFFPSENALRQIEAAHAAGGKEAAERKSLELVGKAIEKAKTLGVSQWTEKKTFTVIDGRAWESIPFALKELRLLATPEGKAALQDLVREIVLDEVLK